MLTNIRIKNYKLFKDFTLKDLPQFLLIGGKNNCGKTSLLEALFLSLDYENPTMFMSHLGWRGLNTFSNNAESLFAPSFHNFTLKQPIIFEYVINSSKQKMEYTFLPATQVPFVIKQKKDIELPKNVDTLGGVEITRQLNGKKIKTILKYTKEGLQLEQQKQIIPSERVKAIFITLNINSAQEMYAQMYGELDKHNKTAGIVEALQILEPKIKSLSVIFSGSTPVLYGDTGIGKKIPLALMGQGIDNLISILLGIAEAQNGIALIDEMENGFHYSVIPRIWEAVTQYAKANNTQVIATTHSRELINGAKEGIPNDLKNNFKYMRIERNETQFKTKVYSMDVLSAALETDLAIR